MPDSNAAKIAVSFAEIFGDAVHILDLQRAQRIFRRNSAENKGKAVIFGHLPRRFAEILKIVQIYVFRKIAVIKQGRTEKIGIVDERFDADRFERTAV